jgi:tetratricopeptide (TPR) repeat protein
MEQVIPGEDPDDPDTDPILESVELKEAGDYGEARRTLMNLLVADLRCLDAYAHLGNLAFDHHVEKAIRHYEVGVRIGELSLGENFEGLLPWGHINNRPFLRCLNSYGLCLWRLGRFKEADAVFTRMLWLNPTDNQGVRFFIHDVRNGEAWHE